MQRADRRTRVEYHTPLGMVSTTMHYDRRFAAATASPVPMIVEHLIKTPQDYAPAGYLFEHMDVVPNFERFGRWAAEDMRDDGVAGAHGLHGRVAGPPRSSATCSTPTQFFFHYKDHNAQMRELAEGIEPLFDKAAATSCATRPRRWSGGAPTTTTC